MGIPQPTSTVIVSLGSNVGDRLAHIRRACDALGALPHTRVTALSPIYETEPVGVPDHAAGQLFLNAVALVETRLDALSFSREAHAIEAVLGRTRGGEPNLPRTIDIDIVAFGDIRSAAPELTLPHPRATERRFVLQPLADLWPECRLPGESRTVRELLQALPPRPSAVRFHQP